MRIHMFACFIVMVACGAKTDTGGTALFEGDAPGECSNDADDDRDGLYDCDDPDCLGADACQEGDTDIDTDTDGDSDADADGDSDSDADSDTDPVDRDGDGWSAAEDCDDRDDTVYPGAEEIGWDGVDQDCDGEDAQLPWVAVTRYNTCVVHVDGTLECKGSSYYGLGAEPSGDRWRRVYMDPTGGSACALDDSGVVMCWGLCVNSICNVPSGTFVSLDVGSGHACGTLASGSSVCWGDSYYGEGSIGSGPWTDISAGLYTTCAVDPSGALTCVGDDTYGVVSPPMVSERWIDISVGTYIACGVLSSGTIRCWGMTDVYPVSEVISGSWVSVSTGVYAQCALSSSSEAVCDGLSLGSLGTGFSMMETAYEHICGIKNGEIACFGVCAYGQCEF